VTIPGASGTLVAWVAEFCISLILMGTILAVNRFPRLIKRTGLFAGTLVALYITFEAPLSGMSMNPARTFASALSANLFTGLWIYFTAPVFAMQLAAAFYLRNKGVVYCAKYHHYNRYRCIFNCRFPELLARERVTEAVAGHVEAGGRVGNQPGSSAFAEATADRPPPATTTVNAQ